MPVAVVLGQGMAGATSLAVVRDLGRAGIPVVSFSPSRLNPTRHSRYCAFQHCPDPEREARELLDMLIAEAGNHAGRSVLFAIGDAELVFVTEHAGELLRWFLLPDFPRTLASTLMDKYAQIEIVRSLGIDVPATVCPASATESECIGRELGFPVFVKPRYTRRWPYLGHNKGFVANNAAELRVRLEWAFAAGFQVLVQSVIRGPDHNHCSAYCYVGQEPGKDAACSYRILRKYPAGFGFGVLAESTVEAVLERTSIELLRSLGLRGVAEVEFKCDERDGKWRLIELNPRFSLQHALVSAAGVNLASLEYFDLIGSRSTPSSEYRRGVRWTIAGLDLRASVGQWRRGELSIRQWARSFQGLRAEALIARDDPGPALAYVSRSPRYLWEAAFASARAKPAHQLTSARSGL
jgi:D-aspartate ligase